MHTKMKTRQGLNRRQFLRLGVGATLAAAAGPVLAGADERTLAFHNLHTGESLKAVYWRNGRYLHDGLGAVNRVLRDHYSGEVGVMEPHLLDLLFDLQRRLGVNRPYHIISGYRSPQTNAMLRKTGGGVAKRSLHMNGEAIDVRLPHGDLERLLLAARDLRRGGVGFYPSSKFVHLDVGPYRTWNG